jgi:hypothetical protein
MSNVTVIQTYDRLWIGADSAVSAVIEGKTYRWHEHGQKLFLVDDMVIFCSGVMNLSGEIMRNFSELEDRSLKSLQAVVSSLYKEYVNKNPEQYKPGVSLCLDVLIGKIVDGCSVVYSISPHDNFEIVPRVLENAGQFAIWSGGIRVEESRNAAYSLFSQTLNVDLTFQHTFNEITYEGIGGKLTVYQIDKEGIKELLQTNILEKPNMNRINPDIVDLSYQGVRIEKLLIMAERIIGNIGDFVQISADSIVTGSLKGINMQIGLGSSSFHADASGISLGGISWGLSPFRVDMAGNAWATSMTLSQPSITNGHIVGTDINIGSGQFTVDASGNMVANSATIHGDITSGSTITGAVIKTASGNQRIQMDSTYFRQFSAGGNELLKIGNFYTMPRIDFYDPGNSYGAASIYAFNGFFINASNFPIDIDAGSGSVDISGSSISLNGTDVISALSGKTNVGSSTSSVTVSDNHNHGFSNTDYIQCYDAVGTPTMKKQWVGYTGSAAHSHTTT